ncbi:class I SAM-dependent methyltransferase [Bacteroides sp. AN502(2024)]|uniref:class I SAM-dependent methyltransferase n=1 Tax=Bacteroides sp. AN502(2024) TaxID=3160599 RepID=UPI00351435F2
MQDRHENRNIYFKELSITSRNYFIPYIQCWHPVEATMNVLEIGCGEGGNLLPFSEIGCNTTGVDLAESRIKDARTFFNESHTKGEFIASDIFKLKKLNRSFDIIICHDVLEHITRKELFLSDLSKYLKPQGIVFISFPAWQMPFGGHQQICRNRILSHLPFIHLLPVSIYRLLLKVFKVDADCIKELLSIKKTSVSIESFERLIRKTNLSILNRQLWFINPHYEIKFGLPPYKLNHTISQIPYLRDFASTSCFYLLKEKE